MQPREFPNQRTELKMPAHSHLHRLLIRILLVILLTTGLF